MSVVDGRATGVGTPGYSAPEQFSGGKIAPTADIHALGVLVNACFGGKPPSSWTRIVRRSTSSIPEQRYESVEQFVRAIRHRNRSRWLAVSLVLGLVAIFLIFTLATTVGNADGGKVARQVGPDERQPASIMDSRISDDDARKIFQDTSAENIDTNVQFVNWSEVGETTRTNGATVTKIWLDRRTLKVKEPVVLSGRYKVYISGPGLLDADISGSNGVFVHLARNAAFLNRTSKEYPVSGIMYSLRGESYLNFVNLMPPSDEFIQNVTREDLSEAILRFGGPLSYREAREEAFRKKMGAQRKKRERQRTSHNLRDVGIMDELKGL